MIIALGLLVDDPVVAGDAINRELAHGQPRDVAAWLGPQKLARAILYATVTNCVAFLPLLLVKGRVGDFIYSLPVVVTASLVSSRIVSMTFMPLLGYYVLRGQKGFEAAADEGGCERRVRRATTAASPSGASSHKAITLGVCVHCCCGRRGRAAADRHGLLPQGSARRVHRQRLPGRRLADPPDAGGNAASDPGDRAARRATRSAPTRRSSAKAGRGSGSRSCPNSGPTTTPRSSSTRSIRHVTAGRRARG